MNRYSFFYFAFLQLIANKQKHIAVFLICVVLVMILSIFIFVSSSIKQTILDTINTDADFIVSKTKAGKEVSTPTNWIDQFLLINGISNATQRVYGRYFYEPKQQYFTIVGIDLFDNQIEQNLKKIVKQIDIDKFLSKNYMIIGQGVKKLFDEYQYTNYYNFRPPNRSIKKVFIYDTIDPKLNIIASDMIIMDINLAKDILGIKQQNCTDIIIKAPNKAEHDMILQKLIMAHFDSLIIQKEDLLKAYSNFFDYKSTIFMILYMVILISFLLILYQRYLYIEHTQKKQIAILRSIGWSIQKVIYLKLLENSIIFVFAYIFGVGFGYIYVFVFQAPYVSKLFLGSLNLDVQPYFNSIVHTDIFVMIFGFFIVPILVTIIIPVWRIAITEPLEGMKI